jgi:integrase/recombinase XerD
MTSDTTRPKGYRLVSWLRHRSPEKRGGQEKHPDGFNRDGPTLAVHMDRYLEWMLVQNRTPLSVQSKYFHLKHFIAWCEARDLFLPAAVDRAILENYQQAVWRFRTPEDRPLAYSTQFGRLSAVKCFFRYLARHRVVEINPASELEMPKQHRPLPDPPLTIAEVETLMAAPDIHDHLGLRDRAILETFYSTAIRRAELARLRLEDLHLEKRHLWVRFGKGRKDRVVPIGQRAMTWLEKYLHDVRPLLHVDPRERGLFLTAYGTPFNPDILSRLVKRYLKQTGLDKLKRGCHVLRHTCATHLLEGGADIRYIQQLLGHDNVETTSIYTFVSIDQLQAVHARCHPAERNLPHPAESPAAGTTASPHAAREPAAVPQPSSPSV